MLYQNSRNIGEVYRGTKLIGKIYKGETKIYDVNPFVKNTVLHNASPSTYTLILPRGVYKIALGGAKGGNSASPAGGYYWGISGGGGAFVELTFFNPTKQEMVISAPSSGDAYMNLSGVRMITAGGGSNAVPTAAGSGGRVTVNELLDVLNTNKSVSGNNGSTAPYATPDVASVSTYGNWGSTANSSGGARLEYIRYVR